MKVNVKIQFDKNDYVIQNNHMRNLNFVKCCDVLKLHEYEEFNKLLQSKYWNFDNCIMVMETINDNNLEHFKYILKYIEIENIEDVILYCCKYGKLIIFDFLIIGTDIKHNIQKYCDMSLYNSTKMVEKYKEIIKITDVMIHNAVVSNTLKLIQWLYKNGGDLKLIIKKSLKYVCSINILQWLFDISVISDNIDFWDGHDIDMAFYEENNPRVNKYIKWILSNSKVRKMLISYYNDFDIESMLLESNNITMYRWAIENKYLISEDVTGYIYDILFNFTRGCASYRVNDEVYANMDWIISIGCNFINEDAYHNAYEDIIDYKGPFIVDNNPLGKYLDRRWNCRIEAKWYSEYDFEEMLSRIDYYENDEITPTQAINKFLYFANQLIGDKYIKNIDILLKYHDGKFTIMNWLIKNLHYLNKDTFVMAKELFNISMMYLLIKNNCPYDKHNIPWLPGYNTESKENNIKDISYCMINKNITLFDMKWILGYRPDPNNKKNDIMALEYSGPKIPKYLPNASIFATVVESKDIETIKLLLHHKCPMDVNIFKAAVETGNYTIIRLLLDNGCPYKKNIN